MVVNIWVEGRLKRNGAWLEANKVGIGSPPFLNVYLRGKTLDDYVSLRKELYKSSTAVCLGMWHYDTGEPVGGVGSPWFQTPKDKAGDFMLLTGQAPRKFI